MAETKDIIKAALDQDAVEVQKTVADLMLDKIRDAVEDRKAELAQQYFNAAYPELNDEEDVDVDLDDDELDEFDDDSEEDLEEFDDETEQEEDLEDQEGDENETA